jgi:hypothetical protein
MQVENRNKISEVREYPWNLQKKDEEEKEKVRKFFTNFDEQENVYNRDILRRICFSDIISLA